MNTDPIKLELYKNILTSVAEEMGVTLQRTAFSPNIKERLDFSCAVFDGTGKMVAQAAHIPVHLGLSSTTRIVAVRTYPILRWLPLFFQMRNRVMERTALSFLWRTAHTTQMSAV